MNTNISDYMIINAYFEQNKTTRVIFVFAATWQDKIHNLPEA